MLAPGAPSSRFDVAIIIQERLDVCIDAIEKVAVVVHSMLVLWSRINGYASVLARLVELKEFTIFDQESREEL